MVDLVLGWFVIAVPFIVSVGATVLALKLPPERHYWRYVSAAVALGIVFSGLTYWQQVRVAKGSTADREKAIQETSARVAKETTDTITKAMTTEYQGVIDSLTTQVGDLKGQLGAQGKKVDAIGSSPFISGHVPVPVRVTNPSDESPSPAHLGHLTVSQKSDISTREDAPYLTIVTVQSDIDFPNLRLAIFCDHDLVAAGGGMNGVSMGTASGILNGHQNGAGYQYQSATPPFGPSNPTIFHVWSKVPVNCTNAATF